MQIINVNVKENVVDVENANVLTSGSANIVKCIFNLDAIWEDYTITAIFTTSNKAYRTVLEDNMCIIPYEVLQKKGKVQIGLYGTKVQNDVLLERYTTTLADIIVIEGSYAEATEADVPDADIWERYIAEVKALQEEAKRSAELAQQSATNSANNAINARASATNASNSATNSSKSADIAVQAKTDINTIKVEIDSMAKEVTNNKAVTDKNVDKTKADVLEAKASADTATQKATEVEAKAIQVNADKETVAQAKTETLAAKNVVLNSLEEERKKSNLNYAGALKAEVIKQKNAKLETDISYLQNVVLHGESVQNGEPSLDNAVEIENVSIRNKINMYNRNLIRMNLKSGSLNGISYTVNADNSITLNGTATADTYVNLDFDSLNPLILEQTYHTLSAGIVLPKRSNACYKKARRCYPAVKIRECNICNS